ncbi:MAG TPA: GNAT family N-acetyltransferase [Methanospirillum sp.]|nr:GNAT family N-acetyltransferase [Methanospirillum sp.]
MVRVISSPRLVPAAGTPPKNIAEFIGNVVSGTKSVSIAMMKSPPGWSEPGQIPEFDEYSIVQSGILVITTRSETIKIQSGQAAIAPAGDWVRYSSPEGAEYLAICLPAFSPDLVHRDSLPEEEPGTESANIRIVPEIRYEEYGREGLSLIEDIWNQLREHHAACARNFKTQIASRTFADRHDDILKTNLNREILVYLARVQNTDDIVGFCISSATSGDYGEIESIYVKTGFRSLGIGTLLMNRACCWLDETGVTEYRVNVSEGNEDSFRFYERFGFYPRRHLLIQKKDAIP